MFLITTKEDTHKWCHHSFRKGDCILSVNGVSMKDLSLLDAHQMLRSLPPGPVHIVAARDVVSKMFKMCNSRQFEAVPCQLHHTAVVLGINNPATAGLKLDHEQMMKNLIKNWVTRPSNILSYFSLILDLCCKTIFLNIGDQRQESKLLLKTRRDRPKTTFMKRVWTDLLMWINVKLKRLT